MGRPIQAQTWESFSRTWEVDVKQTFSWAREALLLPLDPGSTGRRRSFTSGTVVVSSAARNDDPPDLLSYSCSYYTGDPSSPDNGLPGWYYYRYLAD